MPIPPAPLSKRQTSLLHQFERGNFNIAQLAASIGYNEKTIYCLFVHWQDHETLDLKRNRQRKRKLTIMQIHQIKSWAKANRKSNSENLADQFFELYEVPIDRTTIWRTLKSIGVVKKVSQKSPKLSPAAKLNRLNWCNSHVDWTTQEWSKVIFTDETCFRLHSNYIQVWHDTVEEDVPYFEAPVHIPGIMVYGAICSTGKIGLIMHTDSFNTSVYCNIIKHNILCRV